MFSERWFRTRRWEQRLDAELQFHIEQHIADAVRSGMSPEEARRQALIEFGGVDQIKEECRDTRRFAFLESIVQDLRFALRSIRKHPLLSVVIVATLSLGIGINAGVFTLINAVMFRPQIDRDPDSFLHVYPMYTQDNRAVRSRGISTLTDYEAFRDTSRTLQHLAAFSIANAPFSPEDPSELRALLVACNFFSVYTVDQLILGRLIVSEDCSLARPVAVVSEQLWKTHLGSDPEIVGKVFSFNQQLLTVIGVASSPFPGAMYGGQLWLPLTLQPRLGLGQGLYLYGRLRPGFSRDEVQSELRLIAAQQDRLHPGRQTSIVVTDGARFSIPGAGQFLIWAIPLIIGTLSCVTLIACANVTTLLLSRADARQREIAIRLALGAGRGRLLRMLLVETLLLSSVAGAISVYLASRVPHVFAAFIARRGGGFEYHGQLDWRVFSYLAAVTLLAGFASGLSPGLTSLRVELTESLKGHRRLFGVRSGSRLQGTLVELQVALSFVLLAGAAVFVSALHRTITASPGFDTRVILARLHVPQSGTSVTEWTSVHRAIGTRIEALPGVQSFAWGRAPIFSGNTLEVPLPNRPALRTAISTASPRYLSTLRIPILHGRDFHDTDPSLGLGTAPGIITPAFAREAWPNEDPLGKTMRTSTDTLIHVVGVARDTSTVRFGEPDGPMSYVPWDPNARLYDLLVRVAGNEMEASRAVAATVREAVPGVIAQVRTIQGWMDERVASFETLVIMVLILGCLAVLLTIMGIYGVVSFAVSRRKKEMAIRAAMGASKRHIVGTVLYSGFRPIAVGMVLGILITVPASVVLDRVLQRSPFAVDSRDPLSYAAVCLVLATVALLAMLGPARQAASADPIDALRDE